MENWCLEAHTEVLTIIVAFGNLVSGVGVSDSVITCNTWFFHALS